MKKKDYEVLIQKQNVIIFVLKRRECQLRISIIDQLPSSKLTCKMKASRRLLTSLTEKYEDSIREICSPMKEVFIGGISDYPELIDILYGKQIRDSAIKACDELGKI